MFKFAYVYITLILASASMAKVCKKSNKLCQNMRDSGKAASNGPHK